MAASTPLARLAQTSFLLTIQARRSIGTLYTNVSVNVMPSPALSAPRFDLDSPVSVQLVSDTPVNTIILALKYHFANTAANRALELDALIDQVSNERIAYHIKLTCLAAQQVVLVSLANSPLPFDMAESTFVVRLRNPLAPFAASTSQVNVRIRVLPATSFLFHTYPQFTRPSTADQLVVVGNANQGALTNGTLVYQLQTSNPTGSSLVRYAILNENTRSLFYIDQDTIRLYYPLAASFYAASVTDFLLFIEAVDVNNPFIGPARTTLRVQLSVDAFFTTTDNTNNNDNINDYNSNGKSNVVFFTGGNNHPTPYFDRDPIMDTLEVSVNETQALGTPFFSVMAYVHSATSVVYSYCLASSSCSIYFYVFNTGSCRHTSFVRFLRFLLNRFSLFAGNQIILFTYRTRFMPIRPTALSNYCDRSTPLHSVSTIYLCK